MLSKLGTALNFRSSHHGRGALLPKAANTRKNKENGSEQLADEDRLHYIKIYSSVFSSPYGVPPGGRSAKGCEYP